MQSEVQFSNGILYIFLDGEIDEHSASDIRRKIDALIDEHVTAKQAVFELSNISFMDSAGIGFLIGRYKKLSRHGIPMYISRPNPAADKILKMSGVYTLIPKIV